MFFEQIGTTESVEKIEPTARWRPSKSVSRNSKVKDLNLVCHTLLSRFLELQAQYTNYKNTLQSLAQKVGDIEQEIEEHK